MNRVLKKIRWLRFYLKLILEYKYDISRFVEYSSTLSIDDEQKLLSKLIANYHVIEKGLSMKEPKKMFGVAVVHRLCSLVDLYINKKYDCSNVQFQTACAALVNYYDVNIHHDSSDKLFVLHEKIACYRRHAKNRSSTRKIFGRNIKDAKYTNYEEFALSRISTRNFTQEPIDIDIVLNALRISTHYPSVCNRQAGQIIIVTAKEKIANILKIQAGARGFSGDIDKLLIITMNLKMFYDTNERSQAYIDGGIFLHSCLLALHSKGIGCIPLNWAKNRSEDRKLRSCINIEESLTVIAMVGIGNVSEGTYLVPASSRNDINSVVKFV